MSRHRSTSAAVSHWNPQQPRKCDRVCVLSARFILRKCFIRSGCVRAWLVQQCGECGGMPSMPRGLQVHGSGAFADAMRFRPVQLGGEECLRGRPTLQAVVVELTSNVLTKISCIHRRVLTSATLARQECIAQILALPRSRALRGRIPWGTPHPARSVPLDTSVRAQIRSRHRARSASTLQMEQWGVSSAQQDFVVRHWRKHRLSARSGLTGESFHCICCDIRVRNY